MSSVERIGPPRCQNCGGLPGQHERWCGWQPLQAEGKTAPLPPAAIDVDELQAECERVIRLAEPPTVGINPGKLLELVNQMPAILQELRTARQSITRLREHLKRTPRDVYGDRGHTEAEIEALERGEG